ncbi:MAG TPA: S-methyl-5-thioribose-1-phosphate isomerase, partial [Beijerinckiaceae bacterium]|nr:S-methyl-5-thioribose-1-phosphate isomerase [Beijerinckiaceae bacterium]
MRIEGRHYHTIWPDGDAVVVIDQTKLPFRFELKRLASLAEAAEAIRTMVVRGAPLIGATAAYGIVLALRADPSDGALDAAV